MEVENLEAKFAYRKDKANQLQLKITLQNKNSRE